MDFGGWTLANARYLYISMQKTEPTASIVKNERSFCNAVRIARF